MMPFSGSCDTPEEPVETGIITISTKRLGHTTSDATESRNSFSKKAATESEGLL